MRTKAAICLLQSILCIGIIVVAYFLIQETYWKWLIYIITGVIGIYYFIAVLREPYKKIKKEVAVTSFVSGGITELILLNENDTELAHWDLYGKNGIVIGRDVGENYVTVNLSEATYASMIEVEHAVLNYSENDWYIEDISTKNGVSVQKSDGKKYKLAPLQPCKLEKGDIIYIALTRLLIC